MIWKTLRTLISADRINDGIGLVGAGLVSYGFYLAWPPLGFICAGVLLLFFVFSVAVAKNMNENR